MKFHIKLWFYTNEKGTQPDQKLILQKIPEISLKLGFFGVGKKFVPSCSMCSEINQQYRF